MTAVERENFILDHLYIVDPIVDYYAKKCTVDREDLYQSACYGLILAADRFDPERGFKFITYADPWIKKYIRKEISKKNPLKERYHQAKKRPVNFLKQ